MKLNTYRFENDYGVCTCVDGTIFKFDIDDFDRISAHTWRKTNKGTIITYIRRKEVSLSRFILCLSKNDKKVLLREPYDYRKENLFCGNRYKLCDDYYEVECFDKTIFKIDICDYDMVKDYVWHLSNNYIVGKVDKKEIKLHRFLLSPTKEEEIDHKDRDTLNNRRNNLRIISRSENCFNRGLQSNNTSGQVGVYKLTDYNRFAAQINYDGNRIYLGSFDTHEEAVNARKRAEEKYYKHIL